jgi:YVTN family beta-propeller protein
MKLKKIHFFLPFIISLYLSACKIDSPIIPGVSEHNYPKEIGQLILTTCAVPGCHNEISKEAAGGLSLATWDKMFEGSRTGAVIIPFNHEQSPFFLFTNTYSDLGVSVGPSMPVNSDPLSHKDVVMLRDWIEKGAPDANGFIKFSDDPLRSKVYVVNQGCDNVSVIDKKTNLIMRYIDVGNSPQIEAPHMIKISPDKKYWYVIFTAGNSIQKFRTSDDSYSGEINIGLGNWNTFAITSDSKRAFIIDWSANGTIAHVDLENMKVLHQYQGGNLLKFPHGSALSHDDKTLYVTSQSGNYIYKIDVSNPAFPEFDEISLVPGQAPSNFSSLDPHELEISPDGKYYYVACQKSNEVRVMDVQTDQLVSVIQTGVFPQELAFSENTDYLFVTCTEDIVSFPGRRGSVAVINYKTNTLLKHIYTGHQPHGIAVDDKTRQVYVAHRNQDSSGPAPHHVTECGGRNGYLTIIDMNSLDLLSPRRYELSVDPYFIDIR